MQDRLIQADSEEARPPALAASNAQIWLLQPRPHFLLGGLAFWLRAGSKSNSALEGSLEKVAASTSRSKAGSLL